MFGIGFMELSLIALVAIVFVGPKNLPEMMRHVGKFFVQAKKMSNEVKSTFDNVVKEAEQEMHLENLRKIKELTQGSLSKENLVNYMNETTTNDDHEDYDHQHHDTHDDLQNETLEHSEAQSFSELSVDDKNETKS